MASEDTIYKEDEDEQSPVAIKTEEIEIISELPEGDIDSDTSQASTEHSAVGSSTNKFKCYLCSPTVRLEDKESLRMHLINNHPRHETYHCAECNLSIKLIVPFNNHLQRHDKSVRPYKCTQCPLRYASRRCRREHEITKHIVEGEEPKKHCCKSCGKAFLLKRLLWKHRRLNHSNQKQETLHKTFICYLCPDPGTKFESKPALHQHLADDHEQKDRYQCKKCDYSIDIMTTFNTHLSRHDETKRPFSCSICSLRFVRFGIKLEHESTIHNIDHGIAKKQSNGEKFTCSICGVKIANLGHLRRHERQQHQGLKSTHQKHTAENPQERCYSCSTNNIFRNRKALLKHFKNKHSILAEYRCNQCDFSVKKMSTFNQHLSRHDPTRFYKCSYCTLRFKARYTQLNHEAEVHGADNGIFLPCSNCDKKFTNKSRLLHHERNNHQDAAENELPKLKVVANVKDIHQCSICKEIFPRRYIMKQHEREMHNKTSENNSKFNKFQCYLCDNVMAFASKHALNKHLKDSHPKKIEYKCELCNYKTRKILELNKHHSQHKSGEGETKLTGIQSQ